MLTRLHNKFLFKILIAWTVVVLIFNPLITVKVFADDSTPAAAVQETPTPTPDVPSTPTPAPTTTQQTGDAGAASTTSTTANLSETTAPGTITDPTSTCAPPQGSTTCSGGITTDNKVDLTTQTESTASSGVNTASDHSADVNLSTGSSEASGSAETKANIDTVELVATSSATPSIEPQSTPSAEPFVIINTSDGKVVNNQIVDAISGGNIANQNGGNVGINTGDATAVGTIFNLINLNILGTNFQILNITPQATDGNIDLNAIWEKMSSIDFQNSLWLAGDNNTGTLKIVVNNDNSIELENNMQINATTGQNQANGNGGNVNLTTGDAKALGNITNFVNLNLVGSKLLFVNINILSNFTGNLILPRPQGFVSQIGSDGTDMSIWTNQNLAEVNNNVAAGANSGNNTSLGSVTSLQSGDATAVSNSTTIANTDFRGSHRFMMWFNNLGLWSGSILGWSSPDSVETINSQTAMFEAGNSSNPTGDTNGTYPLSISNSNQVNLINNLTVNGVSGENQTASNSGEVKTRTGRATALANLFNLINLNIFGSDLFFGSVNILGNWGGNSIYAFPDTAIAIDGPGGDVKPGDEVEYTVNYKNQGYDLAPDVNVRMNLAKGESYLSDNSGLPASVDGRNLSWNLGSLQPGQAGSFKVKVKIDPGLNPDDLLSFWDKLITRAYADDGLRREKAVVNVKISTSDSQAKTKNDSASFTTQIVFPPNSGNSSENTQRTTLEISAVNSANVWVYDHDTITFFLKVKNTGPVQAKNVILVQHIYDGQPESIGNVEFKLGDIGVGQTVSVEFGLALQTLPPHPYHTVASASGDNADSNEAVTYFEVRSKSLGLIPEVQAAESNQGQDNKTGSVLGAATCPAIEAKKEWWPYVLAAIFATLWFLEMARRKEWDAILERKLRRFKQSFLSR